LDKTFARIAGDVWFESYEGVIFFSVVWLFQRAA
jgi:hypothetical protein